MGAAVACILSHPESGRVWKLFPRPLSLQKGRNPQVSSGLEATTGENILKTECLSSQFTLPHQLGGPINQCSDHFHRKYRL